MPSEVSQIQKAIFCRIPFIQRPPQTRTTGAVTDLKLARAGRERRVHSKGHENFCVLEIDLHICGGETRLHTCIETPRTLHQNEGIILISMYVIMPEC